MEIPIIIAVLISFLLGGLIASFVVKRKLSKSQSTTEEDADSCANERNDELAEKVNALEKQCEESAMRIVASEKEMAQKKEEIKELSATITSLKEKHAKVLDTANVQIKELESQLSNSLNGHIDDSIQAQLKEVAALKKKIRNLEDDIEDNDDEIQELQKKLRKKVSENSDLQECFDKAKREAIRLNEQLDDVQNRLVFQENESKQNTEALSFVAEVLTAQPVSDQSKKTLFQNVDALVSYVEDDLHDNIKDSLNEEDEKKFFGNELKTWAVNKKKSWIQGKTTIAFVGEFSAGKTSIVNRILSQDKPDIPLLPVSTKATTAIPTYISSGVGEFSRFMFVTPDDEQKEISEKTFKRINKEVLDRVDGLSSLIKYFVMTYSNPNLKDLSILDTPGFNSNDKEDAERTIEVINECDALFWVVDVNAGTVNRSSLKLIKGNLTKPLYVVINKIDTKAKSEVDAVENLIAKTFKDEGVTVNGYVRFSGKANLDDMMTVIKNVKRDDSKDLYMDGLLQLVETLKKDCGKKVKDAEKECNRLSHSCDKITEKFNQAISRLGEHCEEVANIPQFSEHLFRKDNFEMSQEEYNKLVEVLQKICDEGCSDLAEIYNRQMEEREKLSDAWNPYFELMDKSKRLDECCEQLKKKNKRLKESNNGK